MIAAVVNELHIGETCDIAKSFSLTQRSKPASIWDVPSSYILKAVQAGGPGLSRAAFISGALRELGVALCRGNASLCRSGAYVATRAAGRAPMRGLAQPSAEVVSACLSPRVWVWGFWFGFALRRVALLCGVFVQLHLALFPTGGPFLPSLSVHL
jgi:hypothetical protein